LKNILVILAILIFLILPVIPTNLYSVQDWSPIELELWNLEQIYMLNYKDKNLDILTNFWHKDFVGWPQWAAEPVDVNTAKRALRKPSETKIIAFKIRQQKIILRGEIAIIYYFIDVDRESQEKEQSTVTYRIIHTWIRENGKWQILGGMSAS
jgi:hypothetical protein